MIRDDDKKKMRCEMMIKKGKERDKKEIKQNEKIWISSSSYM